MTLTVVALLVGCGNQEIPNLSAFQNLTPSQLSSFKTQVRQIPIENFELPTKLPFTVSRASIVPSIFGAKENIPVAISVGDSKVGIQIVASPVPTNAASALPIEWKSLSGRVSTKLYDGTNAIYGRDGQSFVLAWIKKGVEYNLSASNSHNKPDLTEQQLVQVADSFR